jgi:hypothetical protein
MKHFSNFTISITALLATVSCHTLPVRAAHVLQSRGTVQVDCNDSQISDLNSALSNCIDLATAAATAATNGSAEKYKYCTIIIKSLIANNCRFAEYFRTTDPVIRQRVARRYTWIANECLNSPGGITRVFCTEPEGVAVRNDSIAMDGRVALTLIYFRNSDLSFWK